MPVRNCLWGSLVTFMVLLNMACSASVDETEVLAELREAKHAYDASDFVATYEGETNLADGEYSLKQILTVRIAKRGDVVLVTIVSESDGEEPRREFIRYERGDALSCEVGIPGFDDDCVGIEDEPWGPAFFPLPVYGESFGSGDLLEKKALTVRARTIGNLPARCFDISSDASTTEYCFGDDGAYLGGTLVLGGYYIRFRANGLSHDVAAQDVEIPHRIVRP